MRAAIFNANRSRTGVQLATPKLLLTWHRCNHLLALIFNVSGTQMVRMFASFPRPINARQPHMGVHVRGCNMSPVSPFAHLDFQRQSRHAVITCHRFNHLRAFILNPCSKIGMVTRANPMGASFTRIPVYQVRTSRLNARRARAWVDVSCSLNPDHITSTAGDRHKAVHRRG